MKIKSVIPAGVLLGCMAVLLITCDRTPVNSETGGTFPELTGPYLGQTLPDSIPRLFAPGVVSTGMFTRDITMTPDGKEIYFCIAIGNYTYSTILYTREVGGRWTPPEIVPFSGGPGVTDFEPALSRDGSKLFFMSSRPDGNEPPGDQDIWVVERTDGDWGVPKNLGEPVNTDGGEYFPSVTSDGTLYYTHNDKGSGVSHIFRSRWVNGTFMTPEMLPEQVNCGTNRFNAFIAPDENYLIVPAMGMPDAYDGVDYYIVFRDQDDHWSEPVNMGALVNQDNARGWSPYVSPDGRVFFFMATRTTEIEQKDWTYENLKILYNSPGNGNADIYWVDASFIKNLRQSAIGQ